MKIGIFGGTFDPPHYGHLNLAVNMLEKHSLDEIWFCPARYSPHKIGKKCSSVEHRYKMLELLIEKAPHFKVVDFEIKRDGPSYTIDTLHDLHKQFPDVSFYLIIGSDSIPGFFQWRQPEDIVQLAPLLVGTRTPHPDLAFPPNANIKVIQSIKIGLTHTPIIEISSTEIRERAYQKKYLGHMVPQKVIDYLMINDLYSQT